MEGQDGSKPIPSCSSALRDAGPITLLISAFWGVLAIVTGLSFLSGDIDSIKRLAQRGGQVLLGCWLVALGIWAERRD